MREGRRGSIGWIAMHVHEHLHRKHHTSVSFIIQSRRPQRPFPEISELLPSL